MNKKSILSKTSLGSLFFLFGTALSACSSATTEVISSFSSAQKYFSANKKELNKRNLVTILKDSYNSDPKSTVNSLLAGWKYSLLDQKLLENPMDPSRFSKAFGSNTKDDVTPNISEKGLYLAETYPGVSSQIAQVLGVQSQKVTGFSYSWTSKTKFEVKILIKMKGKVGSDGTSQTLIKSFLGTDSKGSGSNNQNGGVTEKDFEGDQANFDGNFIFTYTQPSDGRRLASSNFDPITGTINFPADLQIEVSTSHEKLNTLMTTNTQVGMIKNRSFKGKSFNLLPFFYYALL
ncbi:lipoprotein [Mycoplasmoides pneumoniae]|uniref:Lipoprotein n=3 Tax=Mycoplasmoides pneumoniae TaxID=2104 RepID=A0AB38W6V3_MYCPM|nr:MPN647 family lipoprotein [Mycoplasmoides pneumoniae]ADK86792.1 conserved hypothetical protein [Mycoplasmoides pneumoniae FH]ALA30807.1 hypothetical protein B434_01300 [Mycoplasmoides pneumoniae 19294]ALA36141.1 hypothetical protein F539_03630 [Mycoplasmoides pneumoniae FH]ALA36851.1 hypothetical protein F538_03645 [Mycoplasmoides pneumoniae M1139]ALA37562.1 hypothetical protein RF41_03610 [Mycoplasmoides pneumoniae]